MGGRAALAFRVSDLVFRATATQWYTGVGAGGPHSYHSVSNMLFARDGTLYLSVDDGLARYRNGRFFFFKERLTSPSSVFEDAHGTVWIGNL